VVESKDDHFKDATLFMKSCFHVSKTDTTQRQAKAAGIEALKFYFNSPNEESVINSMLAISALYSTILKTIDKGDYGQ